MQGLASFEGQVAAVGRLADHPGEQLVVWRPDGRVSLMTDAEAVDSPVLLARMADPFYATNRSQSANGHNLINLAGR